MQILFQSSKLLLAWSVLAGLFWPLAADAQRGRILLVTDRYLLEEGTAGLAGYLRELGYEVEVTPGTGTASDYRVLTQARIDNMLSKDLIIMHRATDSGSFNTDATERQTWNNLNVPMLCMSAFLTRANRWNWMPGDQAPHVFADHFFVQPGHPIVSGVGVNMFTASRNLNTANTTNTGNGQLIARAPGSASTNGATIIVWPLNNPGGINYFQGSSGEWYQNRRVFCALHNYHEAGAWTDISENGKEIIARAVEFTMRGTLGPLPPQVLNLVPANNTLFHPAASGLTFNLTNAAPIAPADIRLTLNGVDVSASLVIGGDPLNRTVAYVGLATNVFYTAIIAVTNENGATVSSNRFDTLSVSGTVVIEAEDYNFDGDADTCEVVAPRFPGATGGAFFSNPAPGAYGNKIGFFEVDYFRPAPLADPIYRCSITGTNAIGIRITTDSARTVFTAAGQPDHELTQILAGQWQNYTRILENRVYDVYLRANATVAQQVRLERVGGDPATTNQTTVSLGLFEVPAGAGYRYVPLTDVLGEPVALSLSGATTLRLTALGANNNLNLNFLVLVPSALTALPPYVASVFPPDGATNAPAEPTISASIVDGTSRVLLGSIRLFFDGADVTAAATIIANPAGASLSYVPGALPLLSSHTVRLTYTDNAVPAEDFTNEWSFSVHLPPPPVEILFVVGNINLNVGDAAVFRLLQARATNVVVLTAPASTTADADGKALVVTSSTFTSGDVAAKFRDVTVPVVNWEQAIQDDYLMTGNTAVDRGTVGGQTSLLIVNADHPLAAGLPLGLVTVTTSPQSFSWGLPQGDPTVIATVSTNADMVLIYGYEQGAAMLGGFPAPARRVMIYLDDPTAGSLTSEGTRLVAAALDWALGLRRPTLLTADRVGNTFSVPLVTETGRAYILEYKNSVTEPTWTVVQAVLGTDTVQVLSDPAATVPTRFYRVRVR